MIEVKRRLLPRPWVTAAAVALTTGTAGFSRAADAPGSNAPAPDDSTLTEIVVTAQRRSEKLQDVPISMSAYDAKAINDLGIRSSSDLGQVTPNVDIALPGGAGNQPVITIRGIGINDFDSNNAGPNGVYVDEVYMSSPASQTFQTFDIQQIEILKGPQGTLYGRNTSGGAINFTSVKPSDTAEGDVHAEYGSYETANLEGGIGGPIAPNLDGRMAGTITQSRGYGHNSYNGDAINGVNNGAFRGALLWAPADDLKVLLNVHGGYVNNRPTEYRHVGTFVPGTQYNPVPSVCSVQQTNAGQCIDLYGYGTPAGFYDGAYNRRAHLSVSSLGSYLRVDGKIGDITLTSLTAFEDIHKFHPEDSDAMPYRELEVDYGVASKTITQELRASQTGPRYDWVAGLYYLHEGLRQDQSLDLLLDLDQFFGPRAGDGIAYIQHSHSRQVTESYAAYGQADYSLLDDLKLTAGGRVTDDHRSFHYLGGVELQQNGTDRFGPVQTLADTNESFSKSAFSWRLGLDYHFTSDVHAYASVATGYKSGDFNGSFLSLDPRQIALQLRPVRPETVKAYEVGFKSELLEHRLVFNIAAFYNDYRNMQVFVLVPPPPGDAGTPVSVLDNARRAHTEGIDAQLLVKPTRNLKIDLELGMLRTRLDEFVANVDPSQPSYSGNQLPLAPNTTFSGTIDYTVPLSRGQLDFQLNANYKSFQYFEVSDDPYTVQPAYWIGNARVAYQFPGEQWDVAFFVRNLADKRYLNDAIDLTPTFGFIEEITGAPRFFGGEVNYHF